MVADIEPRIAEEEIDGVESAAKRVVPTDRPVEKKHARVSEKEVQQVHADECLVLATVSSAERKLGVSEKSGHGVRKLLTSMRNTIVLSASLSENVP